MCRSRHGGDISNYIEIWNKILSSEKERRLYFSDPDVYLKRNNINPALVQKAAPEFRLLKAICNPSLLNMVNEGNYTDFLTYLKNDGVLDGFEQSELKKNLTAILKHDSEPLKKAFSAINDKLYDVDPNALNGEDLQYLYNKLLVDNSQFVTVLAAVVIVAIVVTYLSIGVAVTVALTVGIEISVAVHQAITVSSTEEQKAMLLGSGQIMELLDSKNANNFKQARRVALLTGNSQILQELEQDIFIREVGAIFDAASDLGLIELQQQDRKAILSALYRIHQRIDTEL